MNEEVNHHRLKLLMFKHPEKFAELDWIFPKLARWVKLLRQAEHNVAERHRLAAEAAASSKTNNEPQEAARRGNSELGCLHSLSASSSTPSSLSSVSVQDMRIADTKDDDAELLSSSSTNGDRRSSALSQKSDEHSAVVSPCGSSVFDLLQQHGLQNAFDCFINDSVMSVSADAAASVVFPCTLPSKLETSSLPRRSLSGGTGNLVAGTLNCADLEQVSIGTSESVSARPVARPRRSTSNIYRSPTELVLLAAHPPTIVASASKPGASASAASAASSYGASLSRVHELEPAQSTEKAICATIATTNAIDTAAFASSASSAVSASASFANPEFVSRRKRKAAVLDEMESKTEASVPSRSVGSEGQRSRMASEAARICPNQNEVAAKSNAFVSLSSYATYSSDGEDISSSTYRHRSKFSKPPLSGHVSSDDLAPNSSYSFVSVDNVAAKAALESAKEYFFSVQIPRSEEYSNASSNK